MRPWKIINSLKRSIDNIATVNWHSELIAVCGNHGVKPPWKSLAEMKLFSIILQRDMLTITPGR